MKEQSKWTHSLRPLGLVLSLLLTLGLAACGKNAGKTTGPTAKSSDCSACESALAEKSERIKRLDQAIARRKALQDELNTKLAGLVSAGKVKVRWRRGLLIIELPNQLLFALGKADLSPEGRQMITEVAQHVKGITDRRFLVAGHTDNIPVKKKNSTFKSNWELSLMRASTVLQTMLDAGVPPGTIGAAGFGEHDPVSANDDEASRAQNRRTEIVLIPNLEGLLSVE